MNNDPVCGMKVSEESEYRVSYEEHDYLFCTEHCQHKFIENPAQYLKRESGDPVCGMTVTSDSEFHSQYHGHKYYFCGESCLHRFEESMDQYVKETSGKRDTDTNDKYGLYTCPMHPEIQQQGPGSCPKCGMALESMAIPVVSNATEYVCPMHPEIVQDYPGNCPKCGMALEPRTIAVEEDNHELIDMTQRFWVGAILSLPVFILAMIADLTPSWLPNWLSMDMVQWTEFALATPVVLWGGWPLNHVHT